MEIVFNDKVWPRKAEISKASAAKAIGVSLGPLENLIEAGYVPDLDIARIVNIRAAHTICSSDTYPVLRTPRVSLPGLSRMDDEYQFNYWASNITGTSTQKMIQAHLVPVTLSRYVVAVLSVTDYRSNSDGGIDYIGTVAGKAITLGDPGDVIVSDKFDPSQKELVKSMIGCSVFGDSGFRYGYLPVENN